MYLSPHSQIYSCNEQEYEVLVKLVRLFKFTGLPLAQNGSTVTSTSGEFVLSDLYPLCSWRRLCEEFQVR